MLTVGKIFNQRIDSWGIGIIFFNLLFDLEPFYITDQIMMIERIKNEELDFTLPILQSISVEAADLLDQLLQKKPTLRLTPAQILDHPFIIDHLKKSE